MKKPISQNAAFIRENRRKHDITQKELSNQMGMKSTYLSFIETGVRGMSDAYFLTLKSALEEAIKTKYNKIVKL